MASQSGNGDAAADRVSVAERVATRLLHEVRNVLNPIVSAAWLLDANAGDPDKVRELARRIEEFAKAESRLGARVRELIAEESSRVPPAQRAGSDAGAPGSTRSSS